MDSVLYGTSQGGRWGAASCADSPHDGRTVVDTFWEGLPALGRGELVGMYFFQDVGGNEAVGDEMDLLCQVLS